MAVPDLINGDPSLAYNVGVVLGVHLNSHCEAPQFLTHTQRSRYKKYLKNLKQKVISCGQGQPGNKAAAGQLLPVVSLTKGCVLGKCWMAAGWISLSVPL